MTVVIEFVKKHWKVALVVGGVLLLLIGYGAGAMKQPRVVEKEVIKTQVQDHIVYKDRVVEKKVYVAEEQKHVRETTTTTKKPDGTVVTQTTTDTDVDNKKHVDTDKTEDQQKTEDKVITQVVEKTKLVDKELTWRLGAGVGYSFPYTLGQGTLGIPGLNGWVVQASIERRIIGPVWMGLWGNTQGTFGLNASVQW